VKIRDVRTMLLTAPIPEAHHYTSDHGTVMALSAAIVVVETDEGITGYAEAKGTPQVMRSIIEQELKPLLLGQDPARIHYLWELMYNRSRLGLSLYYGREMPIDVAPGELMCAMSGVDIALWDITGKAMGVPIHRLIGGGVRERVRAYASGGHGRVGEVGDQARSYVEKGFKAIKIRAGGKDHPHMVSGTVARVKEVRDAVGPDVDVMIDAHGSTGVKDAMKLARALEEHNLAWFEEPVIYTNLPGLAEVRSSTPIPIAAGERLFTRFAFRDLALARGADIWQPDICMVGGITEALRVAQLASAFEFQFAPHSWGSALLWAANLQIAAALPNYLIFEFGQTYNPLLYELLTTPVRVEKDGYVDIPQGPGLGVEILPDIEKRFPFDPQAVHRKGLI